MRVPNALSATGALSRRAAAEVAQDTEHDAADDPGDQATLEPAASRRLHGDFIDFDSLRLNERGRRGRRRRRV